MIRSIILLIYGGLLLLLALRSLRAQRLKERYVLLLLFTGMPFLFLAIWPDALDFAAKLMSMPYHTLMVLCLAAFLILIIFELLSLVSVQERRIAALAQMVGILMQQQGLTERLSSLPPGETGADSGKGKPQA